jgi:protein-disulfide isomerase
VRLALLISAFALVASQTAPLGARAAPASADWSRTVVKTPAGGFQMGNPQAKVKLVEYGSMSCPHCQAFDATGATPLIDQYVKTGKVSFEFRNFVRDPFDLAAAVVARCNGAKSFFALTRALFRDQPKWLDRAQSAPQDQLEKLGTLKPNELALQAAKLAGFPQWGAAHGLPIARSNVCLTNVNEVNLVVAMRGKAIEQYPDFPGTPTFVLNGNMLEKTVTWDDLQPKLRAALGG